MVTGVTDGFTKELEIHGVGYRANAQGPRNLELALGFSHPVRVEAPEGIEFEVIAATGGQASKIVVKGHRQGEGRPGGRRHPQDPQARALQGQGRPLRRRAHPAQGREDRQVGTDDEHQEEPSTPESAATAGCARRSAAPPSVPAWPCSAPTTTSTPRSSTTSPAAPWPPRHTEDADLKGGAGGNIDAATKVGTLVAERAKAAGVDKVVFDRGGFRYHGRVAALADAARAGGLEF